jgi:RNA-directed DNA polymerase
VGKLETLRASYDLAKRNDGAPGIDGVTLEAIEASGVEAFLAVHCAEHGRVWREL